jgi:hypothetical protein
VTRPTPPVKMINTIAWGYLPPTPLHIVVLKEPVRVYFERRLAGSFFCRETSSCSKSEISWKSLYTLANLM